ncbi:MAG: twin-arginine translocase subunit TatC [Planctomycetota bacterium]|nr:twin-arginine translocase subunit TatC [Planctomycetota bacterium]
MNNKLPADDLFEKSSMSFGEHLEELRKSLGKALIWLGIATIVSLLFANEIVKFVESPLKAAIRDFHVAQAIEAYKNVNGEEPTDAFQAWLSTQGMMPEPVFVDPVLIAQLSNQSLEKSALPAPDEAEEKASEANGKAAEKDAEKKEAADKTSGKKNADKEADASGNDLAGRSMLAAMEPENAWKGITLNELNRLQPVLLWRPIKNKLISLNPTEGFMIWLKAGLVSGVVLASPGIFWHIWQFLAAGLYPHERRYVYWYLPLSLGLFLAGVCLAFFVVFKLVLGFLMNYSTGLDVEFTPRLNDYMSFALFLPLGFGIAFQLPIAMLGLHRFGVVGVDTFVSQWRIAVLVIAFLSMALSPPEIYSMVGLFAPLVLLYFFGIFLCKYMPQGAGIGGPALDPE